MLIDLPRSKWPSVQLFSYNHYCGLRGLLLRVAQVAWQGTWFLDLDNPSSNRCNLSCSSTPIMRVTAVASLIEARHRHTETSLRVRLDLSINENRQKLSRAELSAI